MSFRRKVSLVLCAIVILCGVGGYVVFAGANAPLVILDLRDQSQVSVVLTEEGFVPAYMRVRKGAVVTFSTTRSNQFWPASNPHPSHEIYDLFDPQRPLNPDESWTITIDRVGTWGYHDHIRSYFTGEIYVEG